MFEGGDVNGRLSGYVGGSVPDGRRGDVEGAVPAWPPPPRTSGGGVGPPSLPGPRFAGQAVEE